MSKPKWTGITFDENDVGSCSKCGNKEGFSMVMHLDGAKEYTTVYKCNKCGHIKKIKVKGKLGGK